MGTWFQFHNGTIKAIQYDAANKSLLRFNSTMVRLKPDGDVQYKSGSNVFQFHNGTIKAVKSQKGFPK